MRAVYIPIYRSKPEITEGTERRRDRKAKITSFERERGRFGTRTGIHQRQRSGKERQGIKIGDVLAKVGVGGGVDVDVDAGINVADCGQQERT